MTKNQKTPTRNYLMLALAAFALLVSNAYATSSGEEMRKFVVSLSADGGKKVSDAQLLAAGSDASLLPEGKIGVALQEEFRSDDIWFLLLNAADHQAVDKYLATMEIQAKSVYESLFVNSPVLGGGPKAGSELKSGHKVFMIERAIPGIGLAPLEKKVAVSKGSQKVIESMGGTDKVEWDHSFLTSEGTFCVYRAGDSGLIEEHAKIAGIPADPITEVEHLIRNFNFQ